MQLKPVRQLWGITEPWEDTFPRIQAAGYTALEAPIPPDAEHARFRELLGQYGFDYVAMVFTEGDTVSDHLASFRAQIDQCEGLSPLLINSHSGRDAWSADDGASFFDEALTFERDLDVPIAHETHRGRVFYNPWATARLLDRFPDLRLCCDLSHWVCVCERLLDTEEEIIAQCAERCIHIHARVGFEEGPQVPEPRAPEYREHVEAHERWWRTIWEAQAERGRSYLTVTPEYGPPNYLHTLPYTRMPMADLWEISDWQVQRFAKQVQQAG